MNRAPVCTLGGFPTLRSRPEGWTFTEGSGASMSIFRLRLDDAGKLLAANQNPVDLVMRLENKTQTIKNLYVLHEVPTVNPNVVDVLVADRRWMWGHAVIERDYNVRREVGNIRYISGLTDETAVITPQVTYWEWSLRSGPRIQTFEKWTVSQVIDDIMKDILAVETTLTGAVPANMFLFPGGGKEETDKVEIQNLSYSGDGGDAAINRLLSMVPGLGVTLDENSDVIWYRKDLGINSIPGLNLGPISEARGVFVFANNRLLRPSKINVRMEREVELRLDASHDDSSETQVQPDPLSLYLTNVAPIPDTQLVVNGVTYPMGTWMSIDDLMTGWNATTVDTIRITDKLIRQALVPLGIDLFARLKQIGIQLPKTAIVARCACIQNHYRSTYQISKFWMNKIKSLRAYTLFTINIETGGRAPAICYSNYSIQPSGRGKLVRSIDDQLVFIDVRGYPSNGLLFPQMPVAGRAGVTDDPVQVAQCKVRIVDADQGIIHLDWVTDPYDNQNAIIPSLISRPPNANLMDAEREQNPMCVDAICKRLARGEYPELAAFDQKSILMSAVPASPNDRRRLHTVTVTPDDVNTHFQIDVGECVGPEMDVFIGPNMITAKIAWRDAKKEDILKCFGYPENSGQPNLEGIILNQQTPQTFRPGEPSSAAGINDAAISFAAQIYVSLMDRIQGEQASDFNPKVGLQGWEESVQHVVESGGKMLTIVRFLPRIPRMNIMQFLDSSTRRAIFRIAQPPATT